MVLQHTSGRASNHSSHAFPQQQPNRCPLARCRTTCRWRSSWRCCTPGTPGCCRSCRTSRASSRAQAARCWAPPARAASLQVCWGVADVGANGPLGAVPGGVSVMQACCVSACWQGAGGGREGGLSFFFQHHWCLSSLTTPPSHTPCCVPNPQVWRTPSTRGRCGCGSPSACSWTPTAPSPLTSPCPARRAPLARCACLHAEMGCSPSFHGSKFLRPTTTPNPPPLAVCGWHQVAAGAVAPAAAGHGGQLDPAHWGHRGGRADAGALRCAVHAVHTGAGGEVGAEPVAVAHLQQICSACKSACSGAGGISGCCSELTSSALLFSVCPPAGPGHRCAAAHPEGARHPGRQGVHPGRREDGELLCRR